MRAVALTPILGPLTPDNVLRWTRERIGALCNASQQPGPADVLWESKFPGMLVAVARGVDFNDDNSDTEIPIKLPSGFTRFRVGGVFISGANGTLTTATCGLFTAAAAGGVAVVTGGSAITVANGTANTNNNAQSLTVNNQSTLVYSVESLFFRVGTAQGAARTADVSILIQPLP